MLRTGQDRVFTWTRDTAIVAIEPAAARCPSSRCPAIRSSLRPCRNSAGRTGTWVRPQIPGFSPGGLGPHLTAAGSPAGFPPVSRLPARALPLRPPCSGFPSPGVLRFRPFGRRCPVRFPSVSLRFPFPRATFTLALPPGGSAGVGPVRARPRSPVPGAIPGSDPPGPPAPQMFPGERIGSRGAAGRPHHRLLLGSRDDPGSWRPEPGSFQRRARPGP